MWKVSGEVIVSLCVCMYIHCMHSHDTDTFACVRLRCIFGCRSRGVNVRERVFGRLKVRHDAAVQSEWAPLACAPAAAWILFCYTNQGCLSGLLCLRVLYLSNIEEQKAIFRQVGNDGKHSLVWLNCCGHKYSFRVDNMIVFSFSIIVFFVFLF